MKTLYLEEQAEHEKEIQEQAKYEELVSEELKGAFVETENGRYELQIPEDFETTLTEEQITELETNLKKTYEMLDNGEIAIDEETGDYYTPGEDDVFKVQGRSTKFIKNLYYKFWRVKIWHGFIVDLSARDSILLGISALLLSITASVLAWPQIKEFFMGKAASTIKAAIKTTPSKKFIIASSFALIGISLKAESILDNVIDVILQVFKVFSISLTAIKMLKNIFGPAGPVITVLWELGGHLISKIFLTSALAMTFFGIVSGGSRLKLRNYIHFSAWK